MANWRVESVKETRQERLISIRQKRELPITERSFKLCRSTAIDGSLKSENTCNSTGVMRVNMFPSQTFHRKTEINARRLI